MNRFQGKTVLVTGANGFIAGRLAERLFLEEGATVRILIRNWTNAAWISRLPAEFIDGDVTDPVAVDRAVSGCSYVFHCASGGNDHDSYHRNNVEGTRNVLMACRKFGVQQTVYLSSITVFGCRLPPMIDEQTRRIRTGRAYSNSKVAAEELIESLQDPVSLPTVIIRPTFVWGPRAHQFTVGLMSAIAGGTLRVIDHGSHSCPAVYVENLVEMMLLAALRPKAAGQSFNATDGQGYSWADFLNSYADILHTNKLASLSSTSLANRLGSRLIEQCQQLVNKLQGSPAPFWKRAVRRSARELALLLQRRGIPDPWYMELYASKTRISQEREREIVGYHPRSALHQMMSQTEQWVLDQLGVRFGLTDEFGLPHRPLVFAANMVDSSTSRHLEADAEMCKP